MNLLSLFQFFFFQKYLNKLWAVLGTTRSYDIELRTVEKLVKKLIFDSKLDMFAASGVGYRREQVCKFAHFSLFGGRRRAYFFRDEMKKRYFFALKRGIWGF